MENQEKGFLDDVDHDTEVDKSFRKPKKQLSKYNLVLVCTGTYQYMTVHDSTRIPHLYKAVRTSTYSKQDM